MTTLPAVETELRKQCGELPSPMLEVCHYATRGGRRIRAALLLEAAGQNGSCAVQAAAALELLHAATLLQDDIFDSGCLRRGQAAAHVQFGKALTILASDWLLIRSLELAADVHPHFFRSMARAGRAMAQAEAMELHPPALHATGEALKINQEVARGKTAVLFSTVFCGAAVLRGLEPDMTERWERIGIQFGLVYQLVDDCVDIYGSEAEAQKNLGSDLTAGRLTLPVLLALTVLETRGIPLSPESLKTGFTTPEQQLQLQTILHGEEIKSQVQSCLRRKLRMHCQEADSAGIPSSAVRLWFADLSAKVDACFRSKREVHEGYTERVAAGPNQLFTA